jgi:transcriptional regulator with XRE-family HTH domain
MEKQTRQLYLKILGEKLKRSRVTHGLSLRRLSILCDIDHSDISKIERGQINMRVGTLIALTKALDIHLKNIFDFEIVTDDEQPDPPSY